MMLRVDLRFIIVFCIIYSTSGYGVNSTFPFVLTRVGKHMLTTLSRLSSVGQTTETAKENSVVQSTAEPSTFIISTAEQSTGKPQTLKHTIEYNTTQKLTISNRSPTGKTSATQLRTLDRASAIRTTFKLRTLTHASVEGTTTSLSTHKPTLEESATMSEQRTFTHPSVEKTTTNVPTHKPTLEESATMPELYTTPNVPTHKPSLEESATMPELRTLQKTAPSVSTHNPTSEESATMPALRTFTHPSATPSVHAYKPTSGVNVTMHKLRTLTHLSVERTTTFTQPLTRDRTTRKLVTFTGPVTGRTTPRLRTITLSKINPSISPMTPRLLTENYYYDSLILTSLVPIDIQKITTASMYELQTERISTMKLYTQTTRKQGPNHPVEQGWVMYAAPVIRNDEEEEAEDRFTIIDGNLARVHTNIAVYGDFKYVYESWKLFVSVVLAFLILCTTVFSYLLIRRHGNNSQMNTCSTILLISVAFSDVGTIACALTENVYASYKTDANFDTMPFESCNTMLIIQRLSSIPHTISLWLTLLLSLQRCICVCRPFSAKEHITLKKTTLTIFCIITAAIGYHVPRFLDIDFVVIAISKDQYPGQVIVTCDTVFKSWVRDSRLYESLYLWTRFALLKSLPCLLLVVLSCAMFRALKRNSKERKNLQRGKTNNSSTGLSVYIIIVSIVIVIAELPIGVLSCIYAVSISLRITIIPFDTLKRFAMIADVILYISYCFIFLIYVVMTKHVRGSISEFVVWVLVKASTVCLFGKKEVYRARAKEVQSSASEQSCECTSSISSNSTVVHFQQLQHRF